MVHVNRNILPSKENDRLFKQLDRTLGEMDQKSISIFLHEILGHEERLTIAKRLGAIILIHEGLSEYRAARLLKLSPTTTGKIAKGVRTNAFTGTLSLLKKNKRHYIALLKTLDMILHVGGLMPHRTGLDRYRNL